MADMFNNLSGDASSQYNAYNNIQPQKANVGGHESGYNHSWKRTPRPFGLNVRVPQSPLGGVRTQRLVKELLKEIALAPFNAATNYFKTNENVFNGNVAREIESLHRQQKVTIELLQDADDIVMTEAPSFMMDM
ncbi:hypothetical protein IKJ53_07725 [bacterium]|nr:hypothetical protein [bacterium]